MKLPDTACILYHVIYVRSKFAAGIANWKHSHCLFFPLGRLAGNIQIEKGTVSPIHIWYSPSSFQKTSPAFWLLVFPPTVHCHHTVPMQLVSVFWEQRVMKTFGSKGATASHKSYKKGNQPSLELQAREEARCYAHLALAAARTAGGRIGVSRCAPQSQSQ